MALSGFHPLVRHWFTDTLGEPTSAQRLGWAAIREKRHTLIAAPTGSGKTLAAFLKALDELFREGLEQTLPNEVRVVYVSPLKALSADIHKNLAEPRREIRRLAEEQGIEAPRITAAVRTGDTPQSERAAMLKAPPHILVTTPESLYLLLTAERSREMLRTVRTVIVDEIHAVIGTRRGAHLALSLERLQQVAERPLVRLGLSATQKPIEEVARFLVGTPFVAEGRPDCVIVDEGHRRAMDLGLEIPRSPLDAVMSHEVWEEYYGRLTELIEQHRTTLVFVNTRKMAERVAHHLSERLGEEAVTAHHGSLSKETRLDAEERLKQGRLRALVATASLELGIDIGHVDLVCQIGSPHRIATFLQRIGRSGHTISGLPKGRLFPVSLDDLVECSALLRAVHLGELDRIVAHEAPLDVLAQQIVAECSSDDYSEDGLFEVIRRAWPYRNLTRKDFDEVVTMVAEGFATRRGRRGALLHRDEVNGRVRGRRGSRLLAITSGGAIPEVADYRVVLEGDEIFIGTLNEDFAIESNAGDIFQLGNASWRVIQVGSGMVRVADAKGAPPNIPFWLGEAPARSDELSKAVSELRHFVDQGLSESADLDAVIHSVAEECGVSREASREAVSFLAAARQALGVLPTQETLVLERFFDESGGMQLVLHAPFGSRINKAWGLALRKRFCRQFNFELQAAATEDAILLSLGPQHSFPLADVFRYLHPATCREILVQAFLAAPVFPTRWRWNTTISLAIPRNRGGKKVPQPLQRAMADDLMAAVFPDGAACAENLAGDIELPDHPLVNQVVRDCLEEAMDFDGLERVLRRIHAGELECIARDMPEPSPLTHEILTAKPYAFLDDAPLEERRTQAVQARRAGDRGANDLGALDMAAIERVRDEERPDPRDADELHDVLLTAGFLTMEEGEGILPELFEELVAARRASRCAVEANGPVIWMAAERLPELAAIHSGADVLDGAVAPSRRIERVWMREEALVELIRGRISLLGPVTAATLAGSLGVEVVAVDVALLKLESEGVVLRGTFTPSRQRGELEWCDRRLLARIHGYTLNRLRAEIEPVTATIFTRFLFTWQHAIPATRLAGVDGLHALIEQLDGYEAAASAWESSILPLRIDRYDPALLDQLCLTGEVGWARVSPSSSEPSRVVGATPVALFLQDSAPVWLGIGEGEEEEIMMSDEAGRVLSVLRERGALFEREIAALSGLGREAVRQGLGELVALGLAGADAFGGLRSLMNGSAGTVRGGRVSASGRWSRLERAPVSSVEAAAEHQARALLRRYGVVLRRLVAREPSVLPWRELARVYRRMEARGEIRGGRFVSGMQGEQFAVSEAVRRLREIRRTPPSGEPIVISAADPLNLTGILDSGERVRAVASNTITYVDGMPLGCGAQRSEAPLCSAVRSTVLVRR